MHPMRAERLCTARISTHFNIAAAVTPALFAHARGLAFAPSLRAFRVRISSLPFLPKYSVSLRPSR
ncbi:hypothetical protein PSAC2689_30285 [Paraburkholderia sacchari]